MAFSTAQRSAILVGFCNLLASRQSKWLLAPTAASFLGTSLCKGVKKCQRERLGAAMASQRFCRPKWPARSQEANPCFKHRQACPINLLSADLRVAHA